MARARMRLIVALCFVQGAFAGCGKYIPAVAPEVLAPKSVEDLQVTTTQGQVSFTWTAPDVDRRGKELKFIDGYAIERKEIAKRGDETNPAIEFDDIGFVKDRHVEVREQLRKEARAQGKIGRTVKAPDDLTHFSFADTTPQSGKTYLYQIVPENQGGVKGVVQQVVKVVFKGAESDVIFIASNEVDPTGDLENNNPVGNQ